MKHLLLIGVIVIAGFGSASAISPFTEIGNLEMEVLESINDLIADINAEIIRINSINGTQISERIEQDVIQTNISVLQGNVTSLLDDKFDTSRMVFTILEDSNSSPCTDAPIPKQGWCPNGGSFNQFNITDANVNDGSFILTHTDKNPNKFTCHVNDIVDGSFVVICGSGPADGAELYYLIIE